MTYSVSSGTLNTTILYHTMELSGNFTLCGEWSPCGDDHEDKDDDINADERCYDTVRLVIFVFDLPRLIQ